MSKIVFHFDEKTQNANKTPVVVTLVDENMINVGREVVSLGTSDEYLLEAPGAGVYQIQALLPSGENILRTVSITETGDQLPSPLILESDDPSPKKGLSWAYAREGIKRSGGLDLNYAAQSPSMSHTGTDEAAGNESTTISIEEAPPLPDRGFNWTPDPTPAPVESRSRFKVKLIGTYAYDNQAHVYFPILTPEYSRSARIKSNRSSQSELWSGGYKIEEISVENLGDMRLVAQFRCSRSMTSGSNRPIYLSLELDGQEYRKQMLVALPPVKNCSALFVLTEDAATSMSRNSGLPPIRALIHINSPEAEALLSYLNAGSTEAARLVGQGIIEETIHKLENDTQKPTEAIIVSYYQLQAGRLDRRDWMKNLADFFPDIADGAVVYATSLLQGEDNERNRIEAKRYLIEASKRGIPAYKLGLRMLFDGLLQVSEFFEGDTEIAEALAVIRPLAAYADWKATTTTLLHDDLSRILPFEPN